MAKKWSLLIINTRKVDDAYCDFIMEQQPDTMWTFREWMLDKHKLKFETTSNHGLVVWGEEKDMLMFTLRYS